MKLRYSQKILIISTITFLVIIVLNVVFTSLLLGKIADINDKVGQIEISSQEREAALNLKDSVLSTVQEREQLDRYFVGSGNVETVKFTKYLEDLALGLKLTQKKTLNYEPAEGLTSSEVISGIRFRFAVSGKWNDVLTFVRSIENLPKAERINSISLNYMPESKSWSADLDFSVIKLK